MAAPSATAAQPHAQSPQALGTLVRLRVLNASELPTHADIAPQQSSGTPPELGSFLLAVLNEAESFMTAYLPARFKTKSTDKQSLPSIAPVELLSHEINAADIPKEVRSAGSGATAESWFARVSIHESAAKEGTASWEEFDQGLRADHSKHEMEYTPDVQDAHKVLDWDSAIERSNRKVDAWADVSMSIMEMVHHIPPPLNDRVFSVLVVTAKQAEEIIVVQIPVDTAGMAGAKYNTKSSKLQSGIYVSIEHGQLIDGGAKVKWQMATASDAKGILPMWAQKMGVPGAVIKDVGLFIGWCAKRRVGEA
ncbi:hypothetical protein BAUCODRAFT_118302 [Baudoinia panamericana UAMH 10762]|uniref:DUF3074 domain-containing protein n=1 Tax=Baudoinia panamericana (strain UAMH 10762) TaxID=717646 RepID=M2M0M0_BAUPA|nr:uncharacterized protein BAUCODRAFT_118302 [Baudoinia panamericana UAMH 10762]EMD00543.1 hypothetical protein BAUCODRAFT_118302 [Baudoinia panamericana UAMH 10762]